MPKNEIKLTAIGADLIKNYNFAMTRSNIYQGNITESINNEILYDYHIEIDLNPILNYKLPTIMELDNMIERSPRVHVYSSTGHLCLCHPEEEYIILKRYEKSIVGFIEDYVKAYFRAYTLFELNAVWPTKEYSHSLEVANIELIEQYLKIKVKLSTIRNLLRLINNNKSYCYCDSGKKITNCHSKNLEEFFELFRTKYLCKKFIVRVQKQIMNRKKIKF
ncbi:MAG: hypothetical protein RBQ97_11700 [Acholeplasma sp.]|nr:hypothetical protein [Acholeplasma sp.]